MCNAGAKHCFGEPLHVRRQGETLFRGTATPATPRDAGRIAGATTESDEDPHLFELAEAVADLGGFLEVEVLRGFLHLFRETGDLLV
jgi:hypothetical protein